MLTAKVLRQGYLEGGGLSHEAVAEALHHSRAAYFRRLRGCEQVARYLSTRSS